MLCRLLLEMLIKLKRYRIGEKGRGRKQDCYSSASAKICFLPEALGEHRFGQEFSMAYGVKIKRLFLLDPNRLSIFSNAAYPFD